jgi:hypothetical protein
MLLALSDSFSSLKSYTPAIENGIKKSVEVLSESLRFTVDKVRTFVKEFLYWSPRALFLAAAYLNAPNVFFTGLIISAIYPEKLKPIISRVCDAFWINRSNTSRCLIILGAALSMHGIPGYAVSFFEATWIGSKL